MRSPNYKHFPSTQTAIPNSPPTSKSIDKNGAKPSHSNFLWAMVRTRSQQKEEAEKNSTTTSSQTGNKEDLRRKKTTKLTVVIPSVISETSPSSSHHQSSSSTITMASTTATTTSNSAKEKSPCDVITLDDFPMTKPSKPLPKSAISMEIVILDSNENTPDDQNPVAPKRRRKQSTITTTTKILQPDAVEFRAIQVLKREQEEQRRERERKAQQEKLKAEQEKLKAEQEAKAKREKEEQEKKKKAEKERRLLEERIGSILDDSGDPSGYQCPICLDGQNTVAEDGRRLLSMSCGHIFCSRCMDNIGKNKPNIECPTCRKNSKKKELRPVFL